VDTQHDLDLDALVPRYQDRLDALQDLRNRFQKEGMAGFPSAYQVVVRCRTNDTLLLSSEYAAHRVLDR
jgi:hypothetical protein